MLAEKEFDYYDFYSGESFDKKETVEETKAIMDKFKKENFLLKGKFEDNEWVFSNNKLNKTTVTIYFSELIGEELLLKMKSWAVYQLEKVSPANVQSKIKNMIRVIIKVNRFDEKNIEKINDIIKENVPKSDLKITMSTIMQFSEFAQIEYAEEYINEIMFSFGKSKNVYNVRDLPKYSDVLIFQHILNDFTSNWSDEEKEFYFPVLMWWKITSVIPMRIVEFCSIKRDCLIKKENETYLVIPRRKQKAVRKDHVEITNEIKITKEIKEIIEEYITLSDSYGETETLLSYKMFKEKIKQKESSNRNKEAFTRANFAYILDVFYDRIVNERYQYEELEKIKPNDTRHFAFCSMMLQGFNPLTIARIGGHRSIESQFHYQQHLDYFTQSHVYYLSKINKLNNSAIFDEDSSIILKDAEINSLQNINKFNYLEKMDIGYCTDKNMDCESDHCQLCSKWFIPREELKEKINELTDFKEVYKKRIQERLETMEFIRKNMIIESSDNTYSPDEQEKLKRESILLNDDINGLSKMMIFEGGNDNE